MNAANNPGAGEVEALAEVISEAILNHRGGESPEHHVARVVLRSDWLAQDRREVAATAWDEGLDAVFASLALGDKSRPSNPYQRRSA